MSFVETYLHKPAYEVTEADLDAFVQQRIEEAQTLEYKAAAAFGQDRLLQAVAAMANSQGGLILLGVASTHGHSGLAIPTSLDWLTDVRKQGKDALENLIASKIEPPPLCHVSTVQSAAGAGFVLLVDVPSSDSPPHMVSGQYWKRVGSRRDFMHHYEVVDAFNRRTNPVLETVVVAASVRETTVAWEVQLAVGTSNKGRTAAEHVFIQVTALKPVELRPPSGWTSSPILSEGPSSCTRYEDVRPVVPDTEMFHAFDSNYLQVIIPKAAPPLAILDFTWGAANSPVSKGEMLLTALDGAQALIPRMRYTLASGQTLALSFPLLTAKIHGTSSL